MACQYRAPSAPSGAFPAVQIAMPPRSNESASAAFVPVAQSSSNHDCSRSPALERHSNMTEPTSCTRIFPEQFMLRLAMVASNSRAAEFENGAHGEQHARPATPAEQFGRDGMPGV